MILQVLEWMLGTTGRALLEFIQNNPWLFNGMAIIFLGALGLGKYQLKKIMDKTKDLVRQSLATRAEEYFDPIDLDGLYTHILPQWESAVTSWVHFIPHRLEFFPVRATLANIRVKFDFSRAWLEAFLILEGYLPPKPEESDKNSAEKKRKKQKIHRKG